jgi:hypothetical protein
MSMIASTTNAELHDALRDDRWTIAAIAALAFMLTDVGHEVLGHGIGYVLGGGHSWLSTTTRIVGDTRLPDPGWRSLDLGGPAGNLLFAALGWLGQRLIRGSAPRLRLLCLLVLAFSLYWAFGYMIYCGVLGHGDWFALIDGTKMEWLWRLALCGVGIILYRATTLLLAAELHWLIHTNELSSALRVRRLTTISYIAGGVIAGLGALLDPHGPMEILNSGAASSFLASLGLLRTPRFFPRASDRPVNSSAPINRSVPWIAVSAGIAIFYIVVLGRGIRISF